MRRRVEIALALGAVLVAACNAIIGVEDVTAKAPSTSSRDGSVPGNGHTDDDTTGDDDDVVPSDGGPQAPQLPTLALGSGHTCARMLDGTVRCWGEARLGQLGDGANLDAGTDPDPSLRPKVVPGIADAVAIGAGANHTCVVRQGGKLSCWGFNYSGQLGTGDNLKHSSPVDITAATDVVAVAGGFTSTCVIHTDKTASCWGSNTNGQLGDGTKTSSNKPVKVKDLAGVVAIAIGSVHACALVEAAGVYCWGDNTKGQLGGANTEASLVPRQVGGVTEPVEIAASASFTCARQRDGRVVCWGVNDQGQLGNGAPNPNPNPSPILVASLTDAVSLAAGLQHACAVRATGEVVCWGDGAYGELGSGRDAGTPTLVTAAGVKDARKVTAAAFRTCTVRAGGQAQCWGNNIDGELGDGTTNRAYTPVSVSDFP